MILGDPFECISRDQQGLMIQETTIHLSLLISLCLLIFCGVGLITSLTQEPKDVVIDDRPIRDFT